MCESLAMPVIACTRARPDDEASIISHPIICIWNGAGANVDVSNQPSKGRSFKFQTLAIGRVAVTNY
jgi:hypothetical protein